MNKLSDEWLEIDKVILYGWGNIGEKCFSKFHDDFDIISIIDNDSSKWGTFYNIPIIGADNAADILKCNKIIVLTGGKVYKNISESLMELGLKENIDFCSVEVFISEWYWKKRGENCLLEVHTAITMRCTFHCKNCNMFVPYYREKVDYTFAELKQMYDKFFNYINYVFCITLLGGEPFVNSDLGKVIDYLGKEYSGRIGTINVISNGSIVPDDETVDILAQHNVLVYLSDYTSEIAYKSKLEQVVKKLRDNSIKCVIRKSEEWKDFGFPVAPPVIDSDDMIRHMNSCAPIFHGLNDNKFYYCHVAWSAEKAGLYKLQEHDFICLDKLDIKDKRKIVQHALGDMKNKYISLCRLCGGCGEDNLSVIKAAIQKE